jgi:hypothetical protein
MAVFGDAAFDDSFGDTPFGNAAFGDATFRLFLWSSKPLAWYGVWARDSALVVTV